MDQTVTPAAPSKRRRNLLVITLLFLLLAIAYTVYWVLVLSKQQSTDDANVSGHIVQITPEISGTIVKVAVEDTQSVKAGQVLLSLDNSDAQLAFERARHEFAQTVRQTRQLTINTQQLAAQVTLRQTELARAEADLKRRAQLAGSDALSAEELNHAKDSVASAKATLDAAREQQKASNALLGKDVLAEQPNVKAAASRLKEAWLNLQRTEIKAPLSGVIARRNIQVGQKVNAGSPLMAVVPLHQLWVDANFKENQLANMRVGQAVELHSDLHGSDITYHGKVVGLSAGTGSAFALLPAQNATGNWIKVVQRVPVRIQLNPQELMQHPLRVGLSMAAVVDTSHQEGLTLDKAQAFGPPQDIRAQRPDLQQAEQLVQQLLAANTGSAP
ncbi:EmrA/EmrK family multidrug efflux transporter periplasmic adaptor subunit [Neisseriaceae bacterium TC5R-5]|nr:EmrA/EmrK family multidrug efflux transporter periplasmic adaptor subunit [Neisseriaceae bacterium TC5R-5]